MPSYVRVVVVGEAVGRGIAAPGVKAVVTDGEEVEVVDLCDFAAENEIRRVQLEVFFQSRQNFSTGSEFLQLKVRVEDRSVAIDLYVVDDSK